MIRTKTILFVTFLVFILGLFLVLTKSEGADWKLFYKSADTPYYYDADSITYAAKDIIRVWFKSIGGEVAIGDPQKGNMKFKKTKETMELIEINCAQRMYRLLLSEISYEDGKSDITDNPNGEWFHIPPESFYEYHYKAVCPQPKKNPAKK